MAKSDFIFLADSAMQTISVNLPDSLGDFVQHQSADSGVDAFFEVILRERQRELERDKLESELLQGLESGIEEPITPEFWQEVREEARRLTALKKEASKQGKRA